MSGEIWASMRSWRTQQMRCEHSEEVPLGDKSATLAVNIVGSIPTLPTNNTSPYFSSGDTWRIRLIGQDKRLSISK